VGKGTLALELAQALNCEGPEPPCQECSPCRRIAAGIHADVQVVGVEATDGGIHKDISIDQIRELGRVVSLRPFEGRCRVIIIDPADAMNEAAQNAFLKTLEEPPPDVLFVLITSRPQALRATILARCQRWSVAPRQAQLLARLSRGRLGWAIAAHQDEKMMRVRHEALTDIRALPERTIQERFGYASEVVGRFSRDRTTVLAVLDLWRDWWRDVLLASSGCQDVITNLDLWDILKAEASRYDPAQVVAFLRSLAATKRRLEENVNPRLALEVLMLDLPAPR